jgi:hypothetical protein
MTHKIILTMPFYYAYGAQPLCLHGVTLQGYKLAIAPVQPTSSHTIFHHLPASFPTAEKK